MPNSEIKIRIWKGVDKRPTARIINPQSFERLVNLWAPTPAGLEQLPGSVLFAQDIYLGAAVEDTPDSNEPVDDGVVRPGIVAEVLDINVPVTGQRVLMHPIAVIGGIQAFNPDLTTVLDTPIFTASF